MIRAIRTILAAAAFASLAAAPALSHADEAAEAAARLAAQPGFRAKIEARDAIAGRTFTATVLYRAPDRALALIPPFDWVAIEGGRVSVFEDGVLRTCDVGAWLRRTGQALATCVAEARAIGGETAGAGGSSGPGGHGGHDAVPFDLAAASDRLGIALEVDMRRLEGRVGIALLLTHAVDSAARAAPGFAFRAADPIEVAFVGASGFPDTARLRGPTGRVEAELRTISFEPLTGVPDALLAPPATTRTAETVEPAPRLKESVVREALGALLGPLRAGATRDPGLLERESERVDRLLIDAYTVILNAGYDETRLRAEARRAVQAESAVVIAAVSAASEARRKQTKDVLRARFGENCRRQLRDSVGELVRIVEGTLAAVPSAPRTDDVARKRLLAATPAAALAAFERAIVAPMEAEAASEIERLSSLGREASSNATSGGGVAKAGAAERASTPAPGDKRP